MDYNLIQSYIKEMNAALKDASDITTVEQFKKLINLEAKFARRLRSIAGGKQIYKDFITHIVKDRDLREARPFFRERENMFKDIINPAIKNRHPNVLYGLRLNFLFCNFAITTLTNKLTENKTLDTKLVDIYNEIKSIRESLIYKHLHYAVNRAKAFNSGANASVDFGDLIQVANEALISAVDKYVIDENASEFHTMATGKMISNLIASGDQASPVTFGPQASRRLYQIKKLLQKTPGLSTKELADIIGTLEEEVSTLINATKFKSMDENLGDEENDSVPTITLQDFLPALSDQYNDPYLIVEHRNLIQTAAEVFKTLTILEQKILRLKGINFDNYF